jgi:subtilisin-like proprotein convertase family protein
VPKYGNESTGDSDICFDDFLKSLPSDLNIITIMTAARLLFVLLLFTVNTLYIQAQNELFDPQKVNTAKSFLKGKSKEIGLTEVEINNLKVSSQTFSKSSGITNLYFIQTHEGIEVYNAIVNVHIGRSGQVIHYSSRAIPDVATLIGTEKSNSTISPEDAISQASRQLGYTKKSGIQKIKQKGNQEKSTSEIVFGGGDLSARDIPVKPMYQLDEKGNLRLAWDLSIEEPGGTNWWSVRIDAFNGQLLDKTNWMLTCNFGDPTISGECVGTHPHFQVSQNSGTVKSNARIMMAGSYNVYPEPIESPNHGSRSIINTAGDPIASPFGWHDTNGAAGAEYTITRGNNVLANLDNDGNTGTIGYMPDGGAGLNFDFPVDLGMQPNTYIDAAVSNLFYWNNFIHDFAYKYGFDELNGNFQENNYGNGGLGNDYVIAGAQDASGFNNAHFGTPPDGSNPVMRMKLWNTTTPNRDGDFDNGIIAHEYAHGISNRFTGGPAAAGCLNNSEQMGEGWSDYYSLMTTMKPGDTGPMGRGIGTYALGQPTTGVGIRPTRYSTDLGLNANTYDFIKTAAIPHGVGYMWATMLWEMTWGIIDEHGMSAGFDIAMNLVNEGMRLQPCSPGFVDGRNAILAADAALYGGENQCIIWTAFAKRGLGYSASQGSSNSTSDGTQAFDMPPAYLIESADSHVEVCQNLPAIFNLSITSCAGTGSATLSATGNPPGSVLTFTPSVVNVPDAISTMTISNTIVPGDYTITVTATGPLGTSSNEFTLKVINTNLSAPVLVSPLNAAVNVFTTPNLDWNAVVDADFYSVEVATDIGFTNIVYSVSNIEATQASVGTSLNVNTLYFWRVMATNECGGLSTSMIRTFTTGNFSCINGISTDVPKSIGSASPVTVTSTFDFLNCGVIADINVLNLDISHTNTDEVVVRLTSPFGTTITLLDRECAVFTPNILLNLDDQAANANYPCPPTDNGFYQPRQALSAFNGENPVGQWILTVVDLESGDGGSINNWTLNICYTPTSGEIVTCFADQDNDTFGNTIPRLFCGTCPGGYVSNDMDCDDTRVEVNPLATEICDLIDNDCDGLSDEGFDQDEDGFTSCSGDCNDDDPSIYPGAEELCDNVDNNCDGFIDNFAYSSTNVPINIPTTGTPIITSQIILSGISGTITSIRLKDLNISHTFVGDLSATLTAPDGITIFSLFDRPGRVSSGFGCNQNNIFASFDDNAVLSAADFENTCGSTINIAINGTFQSITPFAGLIGTNPNGTWTLTVSDAAGGDGGNLVAWGLEISAGSTQIYYPDNDGDGYGQDLPTSISCTDPIGYVLNNDDCDDTNPAVNPTAVELCNGIDDNCNGLVDTDDMGVMDNIPPTLTCINGAVHFNGEPFYTVESLNLDTADDACGLESVIAVPATITPAQIGQIVPVTFTAIDIAGNTATCISQITVTGLPAGWSQLPDGVGCEDGNSISYDPPTQVFTATSINCYYANPYTSDELAFAQRTLCGNGSLTVQVTGISGADAWAGIMMRETNAPGAKKIQLSTNLISNLTRREVRTQTNGAAVPQNVAALNRFWLRIVRQGNQFIGYTSPNGTQWFHSMTANITMANCIEIGMILTNYTQNSTSVATFANVTHVGAGLPIPQENNSGNVIKVLENQLDFDVFPNPNNGELFLNLSEYTGKSVQVQVLSLTGQILRLQEYDSILNGVQQIDISNLPSGMYLIVVQSDGIPNAVKRLVRE